MSSEPTVEVGEGPDGRPKEGRAAEGESPSDTTTGLVGMTLNGRYHVESKLGGGGIGEVYFARDKPELLSRPVVIKVLQAESLKDEWIATKFRQEVEALTRVEDPGVVGIIDAGTLPDGTPFLVMQYVEGSDLRVAMRPGQGMDFRDVAEIVVQVGRALSAAHEKGVIHRDLKPENIMVRPAAGGGWLVKVIDFGVAKVTGSRIAPGTVGAKIVGTPYYMSPEQLRGGHVTPANDVYSLGLIAYELLTGYKPFDAKTLAQLMDLQRGAAHLRPRGLRPEIPEAAQDAILKALAFEPRDRFQGARAFGDALAQALLGSPAWSPAPAASPPAEPAATPNADGLSLSESLPAGVRDRRVEDDDPETPTVSTVSGRGGRRTVPIRAVAATLAAALVVGALLFYRAAWKSPGGENPSTASTSPASASPERSLSYRLTVRMRNRLAKTFGPPLPSGGSEVFTNGSKFNFNVRPAQTGFLYVFNEGAGPGGTTLWSGIFPHPRHNKGSASVNADEELVTEESTFDENTGAEKVWIVWAERPVPELEAAFRAAFQTRGVMRDAAQQSAVRAFLEKHGTPAPAVERAAGETPLVTLSGRGEVLVGSQVLTHRDYF